MEMAWLLHTLLEVRDSIRADPVRHSHACARDGLSPWGTVVRTNDQSSANRRQRQRSDLPVSYTHLTLPTILRV